MKRILVLLLAIAPFAGCKTTTAGSGASSVKDFGSNGSVVSANLRVAGHPELTGCYTLTFSGSTSVHLNLTNTTAYDADLYPDTSAMSPAGYPFVESGSSNPYVVQWEGDTAGAPIGVWAGRGSSAVKVGDIPPGTNNCGAGGGGAVATNNGSSGAAVTTNNSGSGNSGTISANLSVAGHPELSGCYTLTLGSTSMHLNLRNNSSYDADLYPDASHMTPAGEPFVENGSASPYVVSLEGDTSPNPPYGISAGFGGVYCGHILSGQHGC